MMDGVALSQQVFGPEALKEKSMLICNFSRDNLQITVLVIYMP